jgi:protein TonB
VIPPRFDAAYLKNPPPIYPVASRRMHEHGTVFMRVRVLQQGTAAEVLIEHTSGSPRLDEAAMDAVRHWRFVPARRGTEAVEAWVLVPVEFAMQR